MKSKAGKEKWRNWMSQFDGKIHDFNFGTMLRSNPKVEYEQDSTIFGKPLFALDASAPSLVVCSLY
jgi:hypothetical protein